jgi:hypothetical protein
MVFIRHINLNLIPTNSMLDKGCCSAMAIRRPEKVFILFWIQGYTEYVKACGNGKINDFEDLNTLMNPEVKKA